MPKYFKFIGAIEIVFAIIGFFYFAFNLAQLHALIPIGDPGSSTGFTFMSFLSLVIYAIFAPAIGLLLMAVGEILEKVRNMSSDQSLPGQKETEENSSL